MVALQNILSPETVEKLGWMLLHFVWQAATVALLLAIVLRVLRKSTANLRYVSACLALGLIVLLPVVTLKMVLTPTARRPAHTEPVPVPALVPDEATEEIRHTEMPHAETPVLEQVIQFENAGTSSAMSWKERFIEFFEPVLPYIVSGWLVGVFGLSVWHLGGWTQLQRLRRKMVRQVDVSLHNKLMDLAARLRVNRAVQLMESALVQVPTVVGWLQPVILLPASAATSLSTEQLEALLAHELAHIKRFDYLVNMLQTVVEILGFYHPAVWWVSHKIRVERENCCDDLAVSISGDKVRYARALTSMEEIRASRRELAVAASGGSLLARIRRLIGKDPVADSRASWIPSVVVIVLIATIAIQGGVALTARVQTQGTAESLEQPTTLLDGAAADADIEQARSLISKTTDVNPKDRTSVKLDKKSTTEHRADLDAQTPVETTGAVEFGQVRIVHFPSDRSIGQLYIQDAKAERELTYWFHWTGTAERRDYLCQAKGEVDVPAGKGLCLSINKGGWTDLTWLSKLMPDDLYGLNLTVLLNEPVKPDDRCMPHIAHLTGLKSLRLDRTNVTDKGFKYIRNLRSLEYLHMPHRVTDTGMAYVAELRSLKGLYFGQMGSQVSDPGLRHLAKLISLEELALWGERMGDAGLAYLADLPRLEYLFLCGTHFTDRGLVHLKDIPSLKILSFYEGVARITDAGLVHLSNLPKLETLCLGGMTDITDNGLADMSEMRSLRELEISSSQVTDTGLAHLAQIKTLERLSLPQRDQHITDVGLAYLGQLPNLKYLAVSRVHYVDPNMNKEYYTDKGLEALVKCRGLEELHIGSIGITDVGMEHIAKLTNLRKLHLFGCDNVTDKGLANLAGLKSLTNLDIVHADVTISGLARLNSLSNLKRLGVSDFRRDGGILDISGLKNLENLSLGFSRKLRDAFTDADLACLAGLKRLEWLQIGPRDFSDLGLSYLAGLTNMERLGIGGPELTDEGLKYLVNMKKLNHLTISDAFFDRSKMDFGSGGDITDAGLAHLGQTKSLGYLNITSDNDFSPAAVSRLRRELPHLDFLRINGKGIEPAGYGGYGMGPAESPRQR